VTPEDQRRAVATWGFTDRQAGFLVQVLRHAGVCVPRQYCAYAGIVRGQNTHDFFDRLVRQRHATAHLGRNGRARVYHLSNKRLYRAIGTPDSRLRRVQGLDRTVERLALLDHVLAHPSLRWLATEQEKVEHVQAVTSLRLSELPRLTFVGSEGSTTRYFPDRLPIGVSPDQRRHVLTFVAWQEVPLDFRGFLLRHGEVLRALPEWDIEVVALVAAEAVHQAYERAFREEVTQPLALSTIEELAWYFRQLQGTPEHQSPRWREAQRQFGAPRFRALYRAWQVEGDRVLQATSSRVLLEAVSHKRGRFRYLDAGHRYRHLAPLVNRTATRGGGHERGNTG
jgi:hypothetical protein